MPSGCGKFTFLRSINRMNDLVDICRVEGEIKVEGKNIYDKDVDVVALRAHIAKNLERAGDQICNITEQVSYLVTGEIFENRDA